MKIKIIITHTHIDECTHRITNKNLFDNNMKKTNNICHKQKQQQQQNFIRFVYDDDKHK